MNDFNNCIYDTVYLKEQAFSLLSHCGRNKKEITSVNLDFCSHIAGPLSVLIKTNFFLFS